MTAEINHNSVRNDTDIRNVSSGENISSDNISVVHNTDGNSIRISHAPDTGGYETLPGLSSGHLPDIPFSMSIGDMMLALANMQSSLQEETLEISGNMIEHNKTMIKQNEEDRAEMFKKLEKLKRKIEKEQESAEIWGWIGTAAAVVVSVASMGAAAPLTMGLLALSTTISVTNQILTSAGTYDDMDKSARDGLMAGVIISQLLLTAGAAAATKFASTAAVQGAAGTAAKSTGSAGSALGGAGNAAVRNAADTAVSSSSSMVRSGLSGQQMADDAVSGISRAGKAVKDSGLAGGKQANMNIAGGLDGVKKFENLEKFSSAMTKAGQTAKTSADMVVMANNIRISILQKDQAYLNADNTEIMKTNSFQRALLQQLTSSLAGMVEQINNAMVAAMEAESSFNDTAVGAINNIGANTNAAV